MVISKFEDPPNVIPFSYRLEIGQMSFETTSHAVCPPSKFTIRYDGDDERWIQTILTIKCNGIHIWIRRDVGEFTIFLPREGGGSSAMFLTRHFSWRGNVDYQSVSWGICYAKGEESQRKKRYTGWRRGSGWAVQWHEGITLIWEETDIASSLLCHIDNRPPS